MSKPTVPTFQRSKRPSPTEAAAAGLAQAESAQADRPSPSPSRKPDPDGMTENSNADRVLAIYTPPEPGEEETAGGTVQSGDAADDGFVSRDDFFPIFCGVIGAPNMVIAPPLQSLQVASDPEARGASDAAYELCRSIPWMRFLIRKELEWAQQAAVLGFFVMKIGNAARVEIASRKVARSAERARPVNAARPEPEGPKVDGYTVLGDPADLEKGKAA